MVKGIERVAPMLYFDFEDVHVDVHAVRQDSPLGIVSIDYVLTVDTEETDQRLELLHRNVRNTAPSRKRLQQRPPWTASSPGGDDQASPPYPTTRSSSSRATLEISPATGTHRGQTNTPGGGLRLARLDPHERQVDDREDRQRQAGGQIGCPAGGTASASIRIAPTPIPGGLKKCAPDQQENLL